MEDKLKRAHVAIVFNPAAGSAAAYKQRTLFQELGRHGVLVSLLATSAASDSAANLAAQAAAAGVDAVIAAGGDGTLRQVANGLKGTGVAMSAFPLGTGNVFAHARRGVPVPGQSFSEFVRAYAATIASARAQPMDLVGFRCRDLAGESHQGVAVVAVGIGDVSDAVVNTSPGMKRVFGKYAYLANIGWAGVRFKELPVVLTTPESRRSEELVGACAFNVLPRRLRSLSSQSRFNDGLIDFVGLRSAKFSGLLAAGANGLLGREDRFGRYTGIRCAQLTIESDRPMLLNLDGDAGPRTTKVELSLLSGAVHMISAGCSNREGTV